VCGVVILLAYGAGGAYEYNVEECNAEKRQVRITTISMSHIFNSSSTHSIIKTSFSSMTTSEFQTPAL
jgi:hypothetical protein